MSEMGDDFAALRKISQEKRANNRESSPKILDQAGLLYMTHNKGAHLVVEGECEIADFWPGTGKWIVRVTQQKGRGVRNLVKALT